MQIIAGLVMVMLSIQGVFALSDTPVLEDWHFAAIAVCLVIAIIGVWLAGRGFRRYL